MALPDKVIIEGKDLVEIIPQKPAMAMADKLVDSEADE